MTARSGLQVRGLTATRTEPQPVLRPLRGIDLHAGGGEIVALAGESGSGKSTLLRSILGLMAPGFSLAGEVHFDGEEVTALPPEELRRFRAGTARMVFQDPLAAFHPLKTLGHQMVESARSAMPTLDRREAAARSQEALASVGVTDPAARMKSYPHQVSGGQLQRCMIAMALVARPTMLLCDEPTTALDVTTQAAVLEILRSLAKDDGLLVLIATHDLDVIQDIADRVVVMYAGEVVEVGRVEDVLHAPRHPYTRALLGASVRGRSRERLNAIPGMAPGAADVFPGCSFVGRCPVETPECGQRHPDLVAVGEGQSARCLLVSSIKQEVTS